MLNRRLQWSYQSALTLLSEKDGQGALTPRMRAQRSRQFTKGAHSKSRCGRCALRFSLLGGNCNAVTLCAAAYSR